MRLSAGDRLGRYEIKAPVGKGGMGEVYRARDTELDRDVAVKVLPEAVAGEGDRLRRFKREAKAVARLSHPSVLEIFDFGSEGDITFAVTELLDGKSLREHLDSVGGPLPWEEVRGIAGAVADGLAVAHGGGVVHRDIKPGNLFLCADGRVKILDFGLASLREVVSPEDDTASLMQTASMPGTVMGTVGYMAPEQVRGELADARSDIFAIGCVLYEMLSGKRPFDRDTAPEAMTAILRENPPPLAECGVEVAPEIERTVTRCLEKDPDERFQSVSDLSFALREIAGGEDRESAPVRRRRIGQGRRLALSAVVLVAAVLTVVGVTSLWNRSAPWLGGNVIQSIAVLPLANLSGDPEQEYFADGMTEALITDLSRISALMVISRTSIMQFKGSELSLPEIARRLGVDAVVAGSVQLEADQVRITAQLVDAATDSHLWADTFQRELVGVLALQSEVARSIANAIAIEVSPQEESRLSDVREVDPETYRAYLRGMHHLKKGGEDDFEKGMSYLYEAVENDPADPFAYAGLAQGYVLWGHDAADGAEYFKRAKAAARRALELDENLAEAEAALADVAMYHDWDWETADRSFRRAIDLNPSLAETHAHYAWFHLLQGDWSRAIAEAKMAQEIDPLGPAFTSWLTEVYLGAGRYDEALVENEKALELSPRWARARADRGWALVGKGRFEEAFVEYQAASANSPRWKTHYGRALIKAGRLAEAGQVLDEVMAVRAEVPPPPLASLQALYGDFDGAMESLEYGYESRSALMPWIGSWYDFGDLVDDPRFQDLLERLNLELIARPVG
jgi:serine/threonine protein kinase/tetratricopeptide (TPR) repeat protein